LPSPRKRRKQKLEFIDADGNKLTAIGTGSTQKAAQDKAKLNLEKKKEPSQFPRYRHS
jgi:hypothetical protein